MVEVGKSYQLITLVSDENLYHQVTQWVTVTGVDGNLVEIDGHTVLNLSSPLVHSFTDRDAEKAHNESLQMKMDIKFNP